MKIFPAALAFVLALTFCPISLFANDLKTYQATHDKQIQAIIDELDAQKAFLDIQYERGLDPIKGRFQRIGNLGKLKTVASEMERFKKEKSVPSKVSSKQLPEINALQKTFSKQYARFKEFHANKIVTLNGQYDRALINLQRTLVQSGGLQEATAVENERKRISDLTTKRSVSYARGVQVFNGHHYKIYVTKVSWSGAQQRCKDRGGHLAIINDEEENKFLAGMVQSSSKEGAFVGATDEVNEGKWLWVDGSPMKFKKWLKGQPDNAGKREHYLVFKDALWQDRRKQPNDPKIHAYICEWD